MAAQEFSSEVARQAQLAKQIAAEASAITARIGKLKDLSDSVGAGFQGLSYNAMRDVNSVQFADFLKQTQALNAQADHQQVSSTRQLAASQDGQQAVQRSMGAPTHAPASGISQINRSA